MTKLAALAITLLAAVQCTTAHGYVKTVTIAGQAYQANYPFGDTVVPSGIRRVSDVVPIKGATNPDVECGISAQPAALVLNANPGDLMTFDWRGADDSYVSSTLI
jgi:Auxiliary Activity family 9 (formerly GH61)